MRGETDFTYCVGDRKLEFTCHGLKYRVNSYWAEFECCVLVSGKGEPSDYSLESVKIVNWGIDDDGDDDNLFIVYEDGDVEGEEELEWLPADSWVGKEDCDECKAFFKQILCDKGIQDEILDYARQDGGFNLLFEWEE